MIAIVRMHRANDAKIVDAAGDLGKDLTYFETGLAVALKLPRRAHQRATGAVRTDLRPGHGLSVIFRERGLWIERVHLRHAAIEKKKDDVLRFGRKVRLAGGVGLQHALQTS